MERKGAYPTASVCVRTCVYVNVCVCVCINYLQESQLLGEYRTRVDQPLESVMSPTNTKEGHINFGS